MKDPNYVKPDECPSCFAVIDHATAVGREDVRPKPGDLSICLYCGQALRYDDRLNLVLMSDEEFDALPEDVRSILSRGRQLVKQRLRSKAGAGGPRPTWK